MKFNIQKHWIICKEREELQGVNSCCIKDQIALLSIQLPGLRNKASLCIVKKSCRELCSCSTLVRFQISASRLPRHKTWYTGQGPSMLWPRRVCSSQLSKSILVHSSLHWSKLNKLNIWSHTIHEQVKMKRETISYSWTKIKNAWWLNSAKGPDTTLADL